MQPFGRQKKPIWSIALFQCIYVFKKCKAWFHPNQEDPVIKYWDETKPILHQIHPFSLISRIPPRTMRLPHQSKPRNIRQLLRDTVYRQWFVHQNPFLSGVWSRSLNVLSQWPNQFNAGSLINDQFNRTRRYADIAQPSWLTIASDKTPQKSIQNYQMLMLLMNATRVRECLHLAHITETGIDPLIIASLILVLAIKILFYSK